MQYLTETIKFINDHQIPFRITQTMQYLTQTINPNDHQIPLSIAETMQYLIMSIQYMTSCATFAIYV